MVNLLQPMPCEKTTTGHPEPACCAIEAALQIGMVRFLPSRLHPRLKVERKLEGVKIFLAKGSKVNSELLTHEGQSHAIVCMNLSRPSWQSLSAHKGGVVIEVWVGAG